MGGISALPALFGGAQRDALITPGVLSTAMSFSRSQTPTGASATAQGPDGVAWAEYAADVPRFNGTAQRLLIGGQRINSIRNPRCEGAANGVLGSGGAMPTNWASPAAVTGMTREVVGSGVLASGHAYVDFKLDGTNTSGSTAFMSLWFDGFTNITAATAQVWTASVFVALLSGSLGSATASVQIAEYNNTSVFQAGDTTSFTPGATLTRRVHTRTLTNPGAVSPLSVNSAVLLSIPNGATATNAVIRLAWPQMEQGAFASTPILPPVGTPGASTRGADLVSASLASLGIGANGACTILMRTMIPQNAGIAAQLIAGVDDGTVANRFLLFNDAAGAVIRVQRRLASVSDSASPGTMTAGTPFSLGMSMPGDGTVRASMNGGAVVGTTGGPTTGLTTLRVGGAADGLSNLHGEVGTLRVIPRAMNDAELQAAVAALPV